MKSVFEQEVGEASAEDFLLKLSHAKKQNNWDEHHRVQKLIKNGKQLDHAQEAKLNKLVAANQKKKDYEHEYYQNNQDEHHLLQKLMENDK